MAAHHLKINLDKNGLLFLPGKDSPISDLTLLMIINIILMRLLEKVNYSSGLPLKVCISIEQSLIHFLIPFGRRALLPGGEWIEVTCWTRCGDWFPVEIVWQLGALPQCQDAISSGSLRWGTAQNKHSFMSNAFLLQRYIMMDLLTTRTALAFSINLTCWKETLSAKTKLKLILIQTKQCLNILLGLEGMYGLNWGLIIIRISVLIWRL